MSIEAMKQAIDALQCTRHGHCDHLMADQAIEALRAAIQQAESEPVGFVDFQGTVFWHDGPPPADSLLFAAKPVSHDKAKWCEYVAGMVFAWLEMQENLKEEDRCIKAITGIIERRMWALPTTHPAPSVPADVVRVPVQVLNDASEALGNFVSDHGWGDSDMQAMDNLDAYIALHDAKAKKGRP